MGRNDIGNHVKNHDSVGSQAGIANTPFTRFERVVGTKEDGSPLGVMVAELAARPGLTWWITDEGLMLGAPGSETFTPYVGANAAVFMGEPSSGVYSFQLGSEPIAEFDGGPETVRTGLSSWSKMTSDPTATRIFALDNGLAINHIPNSSAYGTVIF